MKINLEAKIQEITDVHSLNNVMVTTAENTTIQSQISNVLTLTNTLLRTLLETQNKHTQRETFFQFLFVLYLIKKYASHTLERLIHQKISFPPNVLRVFTQTRSGQNSLSKYTQEALDLFEKLIY